MPNIPLPPPLTPVPDDLSSVVLGEGPPTLGELAKFYPSRHTWDDLRSFMRTGDLGLLKRDPVLQKRYSVWAEDIKKEHGTLTNYLINVRLGWGTPPTTNNSPGAILQPLPGNDFQKTPTKLPYFTSQPSPEDVTIIFNDWPYSIPIDISHYLIWSRRPIIHAELFHPSVWAQIERDGIWGFIGLPSEEMADPGDVAPGTSPSDRALILAGSRHVREFVLELWPPHEWEIAWFVNPPRLQSVRDLSHVHVWAKKKHPL